MRHSGERFQKTVTVRKVKCWLRLKLGLLHQVRLVASTAAVEISLPGNLLHNPAELHPTAFIFFHCIELSNLLVQLFIKAQLREVAPQSFRRGSLVHISMAGLLYCICVMCV